VSKTAIVHDYMTQQGGAERVAGWLARLFPEASLHTSVHDTRAVPLSFIGGRPWQTSFLQQPARYTRLKPLLPFFPRAIRSFDLSQAEVVISSSSAFAHQARKRPGSLHVCFCHTPPRFLWETATYFRGRPALATALAPLLARLRGLDIEASKGVDSYIAVSRYIADRIERVYGRHARVIHPPVEIDRFAPSPERSERFLVLSRLVRSKRVDLVVEAANRFSLPLDVIGTGPEQRALERLAGPTVRIHGWQPDGVVRRAMAESTAVVVAGVEDFGLVTAEAQASGRPPVACATGGAAEIIDDGLTGYLFREATPEAIGEAMLRAAGGHLDATDLVVSAKRFDTCVFESSIRTAIEDARWSHTAAAGPSPVDQVKP
jgi:glycosyltransferase involved in cell wall biosynthesis